MNCSFNAEKHKIQSINLVVNMFCNLNCKMCEINRYVKHKKHKIAPHYVYRLLSQFKTYNPDGIVQFDAGEIFANRKITYPYLLHCANIGLKVGIVTNGTLATEEDLEFLRDNLGYFIVSLDSHQQDINDFIRGKGVYEKVVRLLNLLNSKAINYSVNTVVSKLNIDHLYELYLFLNENDYFERHDLNLLSKSFFASGKKRNEFNDAYSFGKVGDKSHAIEKLNEYLYYTNGHKTSYLPAVHECFIELLNLKNDEHLKMPVCNIFKRKLIIDFNGAVRLCYLHMYPSVGNIADENIDLKKLWESVDTQKLRKKMEFCLMRCGKELCNNKHLPFNRLS